MKDARYPSAHFHAGYGMTQRSVRSSGCPTGQRDEAPACGCAEAAKTADCGCREQAREPMCGCMEAMKAPVCGCREQVNLPVMAYVPMQDFGELYSECQALKVGTLFVALNKPFCGKGGCCRD